MKMGQPVYIVCGGTGGHLSPGIATAQRLEAKGVSACLVVSHKEIDSQLMRGYPEISYFRSKAAPFALKPVGLWRFFSHNFAGMVTALRILQRERPAVLLAFGGYLAVSWSLAAWLLRIPLVLHEANRVPGKSIRLLGRFAARVFLPEGVRVSGVPSRRVVRLGMPLRREVRHIAKDRIREQMAIPRSAKVLLVVGGSQGATVLNTWIQEHTAFLAADGVWVLHVSGPGKGGLPAVEHGRSDAGELVEVRRYTFHSALYELFSCADLVVSRAGAGSIAEMVVCLSPAILVPYPHAADGHQEANARFMERRGACILVGQEQVSQLYREVLDTLYNDWLLGRMRENLRGLTGEQAADELVRYLISDDASK
jgi:UDP-N-acetylglucosamine--N-acetylmuramyl-(pentapeptide) pyrophosphoryl-undecaprenol N-acetylglucosamine transferase